MKMRTAGVIAACVALMGLALAVGISLRSPGGFIGERDSPAPAVPGVVTSPAPIPDGPTPDAPSPLEQHDTILAEPPPVSPQIGPPAFVAMFDDLDPSFWYLADRRADGEWMSNDWRPGQVSLTDEGVAMTMAATPPGSPSPLASGMIRVLPAFRYGYFEVRMRVPRDPGIVTGVFTYSRDDGMKSWNEIDIEILGRNTRKIELTIHAGGQSSGKVFDLPFDAADGFHTYAFEWRPDVVRWYVDNALIHEERGAKAEQLYRPQDFMMGLWGSEQLDQWVGDLDVSKGPWSLVLSCAAHAKAYEGRSLCPASP